MEQKVVFYFLRFQFCKGDLEISSFFWHCSIQVYMYITDIDPQRKKRQIKDQNVR